MLTIITEFLSDLPMIGSAIKTIASWFIKTPEQQQQDVATQTQNEENQINKTGRPSQ